jgi:MFS family permease
LTNQVTKGTVSPVTSAGFLRSWYTVILLMFGYFLAMLDRTILPTMIGPIQRDLHITDTQFGLLQGFAFAIFYCIAGIPLGWLADRWSRRNLIATGIALWSMATLLSAGSSTFTYLFLARIGVGVGEATLNPAAYSMMADLFPSNRLTTAVSVFTTGAMAGTGVAFVLGGELVSLLAAHSGFQLPLVGHRTSWQVAFICAGAPGLLLALLLMTIREPARAVSKGTNVDSHSESLAALIHFLKENRASLTLYFAGFSCLNMTLYGFMTWTPALFLRVYHFRPATVGVSIGTALAGCGISGLLVGGALADHWIQAGKRGAHIRVATIAMAAALPFAILLSLSSTAMPGFIALAGLFFCLLLPSGAGPAGLQLMTPPLLRGRISAIFMMIINLAGLGLGPLIVGLLTDHLFHNVLAVGHSLCVLSLLVMPLSVIIFRSAHLRARRLTSC